MKKISCFLIVAGAIFCFDNSASADCVTCPESIEDGKCNTLTIKCERETDPESTSCSRIDSYMNSIGEECPGVGG